MHAATQNLRTLGKLCSDFQVPYHRLTRIVDTESIASAMVLNGVRYFGEEAIEQIAAALAKAKSGEASPNA